RPVGCALMGDPDRQALAPLVGDVEAEHHVMPLYMCLAALLHNALEDLMLLASRRALLRGGDRRRPGVVRAALAVQQQRAASLACGHSSAATGPGSIGLVVEVDADSDQYHEDCCGDP